MTTKIIWKFRCDHISIQYKDMNGNLKDGELIVAHILKPQSTNFCPDCLQTKGEESQAEIRRQESKQYQEKAIAAYRTQGDFIQNQIVEAGDNRVLLAGLKTSLGACQIAWADLVKDIEMEETPPATTSSSAFTAKIHSALDNLKLFRSAEFARRQRQVAVLDMPRETVWTQLYMGQALASEEKVKGLARLIKDMERVKAGYELNVKEIFEDVDIAFKKVWAQAMDLMKE